MAEFGWDCLGRMVSHGRSTGANPWLATYAYRADGMRVSKSVYGKATRYRHDGQMGIEDVETSSAGTTVTRYGLGARGIDLIERTDSSGTMTGFPVYDAHGNMVATLSRNGTNGYAVGDRRIYSAWGDIRGNQVTGDPKGRYCASLGHKADDESGMVYMRARYYEPTTGRFVSEDPARDGTNWFVYCGNDPISGVDPDGRTNWSAVMSGVLCGLLMGLQAAASPNPNDLSISLNFIGGFATGFLAASTSRISETFVDLGAEAGLAKILGIGVSAVGNVVATWAIDQLTGEDSTFLELVCAGAGGALGGVGGQLANWQTLPVSSLAGSITSLGKQAF